MFGVSFVKKWDKFMLQGNGLYKQTTKGFQGNYYGSLSVQNLSLSYTISGENKFCSIDSLSKNSKPKLGFAEKVKNCFINRVCDDFASNKCKVFYIII